MVQLKVDNLAQKVFGSHLLDIVLPTCNKIVCLALSDVTLVY